jgi:transcriptional regulator of nitric oxide reductase
MHLQASDAKWAELVLDFSIRELRPRFVHLTGKFRGVGLAEERGERPRNDRASRQIVLFGVLPEAPEDLVRQ